MNPAIERTKSQVELELKAFEDISISLALLSNSPYYSSIYNLLGEIKATDEFASPTFKEHFKVILMTLVDTVWKPIPKVKPHDHRTSFKGPPSAIKFKAKPRTQTSNISGSASEKQLKSYKSEAMMRPSSPGLLSLQDSLKLTGHSAMLGKSIQDGYNLSQFNHVHGAASFSKSERKMFTPQEAPGPGSYTPERPFVQCVPNVSLKTSGRTPELFIKPDSPGPAAYSPVLISISKRT